MYGIFCVTFALQQPPWKGVLFSHIQFLFLCKLMSFCTSLLAFQTCICFWKGFSLQTFANWFWVRSLLFIKINRVFDKNFWTDVLHKMICTWLRISVSVVIFCREIHLFCVVAAITDDVCISSDRIHSASSASWIVIRTSAFPRGMESIEEVLNYEIGFEDLEKVLNLDKMCI